VQQALLFPTTRNHDHLYGLASHLWIGDGLYPVSTGHGEEPPGLPFFEIRCMCLPQLQG
jgi:hypothetical protein